MHPERSNSKRRDKKFPGARILLRLAIFAALACAAAGAWADTAPSFTQQPANQAVNAGATAKFTVQTTGTQPIAYRWSFWGTPLSDGGRISGATSTSLTISGAQKIDAGNYACTASNTAGTTQSTTGVLTINAPPSFRTPPASLVVNQGATATFTCLTTGTTPIAFQWKKAGVALVNGGRIGGATGAILTITNVAVSDESTYTLTLTNVAGTTTSLPVTLKVNRAITFTLQPVARTVNLGQTATFTCATTGTLPIAYQWKKAGVNVVEGGRNSGTTSTTLKITGTLAADAGSYACTATNMVGSVASTAVNLTVITPPAITVQPANQNINSGATATFQVTATGTAPTYQWRKNTANMTNGGRFSGVLTRTLQITGCTVADQALYTCYVSNAAGNQLSNPGQLKINVVPSILTQPIASQTVNPMTLVQISVATTGTATNLTWQWRKNGSNMTNGGTVSGANTTTLTISSAAKSDQATYTCRVTNIAGNVTSNGSILNVNDAPQILTQPAALTQLNPNLTYNVNVVTSQSSPVNYQWYKNGASLSDDLHISGSVTSALTITSVTISDAAIYRCRISYKSNGAAVLTNNARLIVNPTLFVTTNPANHGTPIPALGNTFWTSNTLVNASIAGSPEVDTTGTARWLCTGFTGTGSVSPSGITTIKSFFITKDSTIIWNWRRQYLLSAVSNPTSAGLVTLSDHVTTATGNWFDTGSNVKVFAIPAPGWGWGSWGGDASGGSTSFTLHLDQPRLVQANFVQLPIITRQPVGQTANPGDTVTFSIDATSSLPITYHWKRNGVYLTDGGKVSGATSGTLILTGVTNDDEGAYVCDVGNDGGATPSDPATLSVNDLPSFKLQPYSQIVNPGDPLNFEVTAAGTPPFSYQWKRNGIPLVDDANTSGSNSSILYLLGAQQADEGAYVCDVTNIVGTAPSNPATLAVNDPPDFFGSPGNQTVNPGSIVNFDLVTTGTSPIFYQWIKDGGFIFDTSRISGAMTPNLTITSATLSDAGIYTCQAINSLGDAVSDPIRLTVNPTLRVYSPRGTPDPALGDNYITTETVVTASILGSPEVDTTGTTRWLAFGWFGGGAVPTTGLTTQTTFILDKNSSITWRWKLQYMLTAYSNPPEGGLVTLRDVVTTATGSWWDADRQLYVRCRPSKGWIFDGWEAAGADAGKGTSASLVMSCPQVVGARFLQLPAVQGQPLSQYVNSGFPAELNALCTGTLPIHYQWYKNGVPLTNDSRVTGTATGRLQIGKMTRDDIGSYRCLIDNIAGNTSTSLALLNIKYRLHVDSPYGAPAPVVGDDFYTTSATINAYILQDTITDSSGTTQQVCTGWLGQGSVPAVGSRPHVIFSLDQDSTLTWTWKNRYYLTTLPIPAEGGWVTPTSGWYDDGTVVQVDSHPALYYDWDHWTGNLIGADSSQPGTIVVVMNRPRRVAPVFKEASGTVVITVNPPTTGWLLVDSNQARYRGNGNTVLMNIPAGPLTMTWLTPWDCQPAAVNPVNKTLPKAGSVQFSEVFMPNGSGPNTVYARIVRYLLGLAVDASGLDLNSDGVIDAADLTKAINLTNTPAKPAASQP